MRIHASSHSDKRKETGLPFPESHRSRRALLLWHQQNCKTSTRVPACQNELRKFSVLLWLASLVNPTVDTRQYAVARMGTHHGSQKHSMRPDGSGETKYNVYCWGTSGGTKIVCRCGNRLGSGRPVNLHGNFSVDTVVHPEEPKKGRCYTLTDDPQIRISGDEFGFQSLLP